MRADLHRYVDLLFDLRPAVEDLSRVRRPRTSDPQPGNSGSRPTINRPTERDALSANPAERWLRQADHVVTEMVRLASEALRAIGEPIPLCVADDCRKPIRPTDRTHKANGEAFHHRCYIRQQRASKRL